MINCNKWADICVLKFLAFLINYHKNSVSTLLAFSKENEFYWRVIQTTFEFLLYRRSQERVTVLHREEKKMITENSWGLAPYSWSSCKKYFDTSCCYVSRQAVQHSSLPQTSQLAYNVIPDDVVFVLHNPLGIVDPLSNLIPNRDKYFMDPFAFASS